MVLWADSFTDGLSPEIPEAIVRVLEDAGLRVLVTAGDACCGVTWISTGQLDGAKKHLNHLLEVLGPFAVNGIPIIGVEPSCTAVLRGDLTELLPEDPRAHAVAAATFTLAEVLTGPRAGQAPRRLAGAAAWPTSPPWCSRTATSTRSWATRPTATCWRAPAPR